MKKTFLFLSFLILNFMQAQDSQDSLNVKQNQQHNYYQELINDFNVTPFLFYITPFKNYTKTSFSISSGAKDVYKKQDAKNNLDINLKGEGIYKYKNTLFVGDVSYTKNYQNSLSWNLTNLFPFKNETEKTPFYNLSYNEGNWNNQYYKINGNIVFPMITDKLYTVIGVKYNTLDFFRTIEPKPNLKYLDLSANISFYYKLKNDFIGIDFLSGFLNSRNNNTLFDGDAALSNIPSNTEVYIRTSYGYGLIESASFLSNKEEEKTKGIGLSYVSNKKKGLVSTNLTYKNIENSFLNFATLTDESTEENIIGTYNIHKISGNIGWYNLQNKHSFTLKGSYTFGENFRTVTQGKNYESSLFNTSATYQIMDEKKGIVKNNYGASLNIYKLNKTDFQVVNSFNFTNLKLSSFYSKDFATSVTKKLYFKSKIAVTFNIDKQAYFLENNRFTLEVSTPDLAINTSTKINTSIDFGYQKKLKKSYINMGIQFSPTYYFNLDSSFILDSKLNHTAQLYFSIIY